MKRFAGLIAALALVIVIIAVCIFAVYLFAVDYCLGILYKQTIHLFR